MVEHDRSQHGAKHRRSSSLICSNGPVN